MSSHLEELQLRVHDLPVSWDGLPVTWGEWEPGPELEGRVFICPPPKVAPHCSRCGSIEKPIRNRGLVASPDVDHPMLQLLVNRCPDCHLDVVWDLEADTRWDLGPEDYGDQGSVPPAPSLPVEKCATPSRSDAAKAWVTAARARARTEQDRLF